MNTTEVEALKWHDRLVIVRKQLKLTQEEFAELGGIAGITQSNYERGLRYPIMTYFYKLQESGIDIRFIILGQRLDAGKLSKKEHQLLSAYQNGPKEQKLALEFLAECKD